jgi:hypothetical protein
VLKGAHDSGLCVLQNTHTLLSIHLDILSPQFCTFLPLVICPNVTLGGIKAGKTFH